MFLCSNDKRAECGITLIEILVVLFILTVVSAIVFIDFRASQRRFALQNAAQQLALDVRKAQAFSLQAKEVGGSTPARFGIHIDGDSTSYILFGDINDNGLYDASGELVDKPSLPPSINFPPVVATLRNSVGNLCGSPSKIDITFKPPDPIVTIIGSSQCFKACIYLSGQGVGQKFVGITETGLVNIYNDINSCIND